jgi:hypothetical protein
MKEIRDWIDAILKVILAIAGMAVGYYFSFQKQQNDDITLIVELMSAKESSKQIMAATIAQEYVSQKRIPPALYEAVYTIGNFSEDKQLQSVVNIGAETASKDNPTIEHALIKANAALPVRIYFHIRQESDRVAAHNIEEKIQSSVDPDLGNKIIVPGIELIKGIQDKSLLKCFKKTECEALGKKLVSILRRNGVQIALSDESKTYEQSTSIRPNHFEAWFAPGTFNND